MSLVNTILSKIQSCGPSRGIKVLATTFVSSLDPDYKVPVRQMYLLDLENRKLVAQLLFFVESKDYDYDEHLEAIDWLLNHDHYLFDIDEL